MRRDEECAADEAFEVLKRLGVRLQRSACPTGLDHDLVWGPTAHAVLAVEAFDSLASGLTSRQINLLNELLFRIRMNREKISV
jgi:hypothetical protein